MNADFYRRITSDLLWNNYNIPFSSGYNNLSFFNGGELKNQGWELYINGLAIKTENTSLGFNFNMSHNNNTFLNFPDNFNNERSTSIGNGDFPRRAVEGQPIGSFYGFRYLGVYADDEEAYARDENGDIMLGVNGEPIPMTYQEVYEFQGGDAKYEDVNHDGKIDLMDVVYLGDSNPSLIGGFGSSFSYKNLSASVQFHYRLGFDIVNEIALETEGMTNKNNQSTAVLHRWRREGQNYEGILPRAYLNHPANNLGSDRYVENGDFARLNNISLQYKFDKKKLTKWNLNSLKVSLNMRKILTFTNYTGQDPEISRGGQNPFWMGTDNARTPVPRIYTVGLSVGF